MITLLPDECLLEIFNNFRTNYRVLFSCLLVSRHWCRIIIPILWSEPTKYVDDLRLIRIYLSALNAEEQALLIPYKISLPTYQKTLFEYSSFTTYVELYFADRNKDGIKNWLFKEGNEDYSFIYFCRNHDNYNYYDDYSYLKYYDIKEFNEQVNVIKYSLIEMFLRTSKKIKHLSIYEPIYDNILFERLLKNDTIISLKFRIKNFETTKLLSEILHKNITLNSLDISGNQLGSDGAEAIAEALRKNTVLTTLHIGDNQTSSKEIIALAKALCVNTALISLSIRFNQLNAEARRALMDALYINTTLTSLEFDGNKLNSKKFKTFVNGVRKDNRLVSLTY
ncbi:RNI-like protein [Gigaspora margarita]|uniref:RNI-like protein n=1 Tax=Gigaspora margarita TaxID=4874 RepID=A0A8H4ENG7_GIGMA|nr:RNI-like protein [Gigaspora margarita]